MTGRTNGRGDFREERAKRRPRVVHAVEGRRWILYDARRGASGLGLGYFVREDLEPGDRRAILSPDHGVPSLASSLFEEIWAAGKGLTATERRVVDDRGDVWLAQSFGPVWAKGRRAASGTGVRLYCVSSERPGIVLRDLGLEATTDAALASAIAASEEGSGRSSA